VNALLGHAPVSFGYTRPATPYVLGPDNDWTPDPDYTITPSPAKPQTITIPVELEGQENWPTLVRVEKKET